MCDCMIFPDTVEEFIEQYKVKDDKEIYTNGVDLLPVFRIKQWMYHHMTPTADVEEVRHGKWLETQEPLGWCDVDCIECSVCHESWIIDEDSSIDDYECMWHYCPNCGAKMTGGKNDDSKKSVRASK